MVMKMTLGMKAAHHQNGTFSSVRREMASEIQPTLRLFSTSGTRSSSRGGSLSTTLLATEAILVCSFLHARRDVFTGARATGRGMRFMVPRLLEVGFGSVRHIVGIRHFLVRIANAGQIGQTRFGVQEFQRSVVAR